MGLCAQAADERRRASWNVEGKKEKEKKERKTIERSEKENKGGREKELEGKTTE